MLLLVIRSMECCHYTGLAIEPACFRAATLLPPHACAVAPGCMDGQSALVAAQDTAWLDMRRRSPDQRAPTHSAGTPTPRRTGRAASGSARGPRRPSGRPAARSPHASAPSTSFTCSSDGKVCAAWTHRRCDARPAPAASCACQLAGCSCSRTSPGAVALIPKAQVHQRSAWRGLPRPHREAEDLRVNRSVARAAAKDQSKKGVVLPLLFLFVSATASYLLQSRGIHQGSHQTVQHKRQLRLQRRDHALHKHTVPVSSQGLGAGACRTSSLRLLKTMEQQSD